MKHKHKKSVLKNENKILLCPSQQRTCDSLKGLMSVANVIDFWGSSGRGVSTVLREFHKENGGTFLNMKEFLDAQSARGKHPLKLEETFFEVVFSHLQSQKIVIVDDLFQLIDVVEKSNQKVDHCENQKVTHPIFIKNIDLQKATQATKYFWGFPQKSALLPL